MQQSFFESSGGAGNWPCHADRIELRGNFMTASWDDWITAPVSITPSALCAVSSLPLSLLSSLVSPLCLWHCFSRILLSPSLLSLFSSFLPSVLCLLARGGFINVTLLHRRVHRIQLSRCRRVATEFFLLNRASFSIHCRALYIDILDINDMVSRTLVI